MLHNQFTVLLLKYSKNEALVQQLWKELETAYSDKGRYFHNLSHLEQVYTALSPFQTQIQDWDSLLLSLFYHDIAYDVMQHVMENDNEERSAVIEEEALDAIGFPAEKTERCKLHILATKTHRATTDADTNFFIDADLSVLGQPWEVYHTYFRNIHREYAVYPEAIYYSGRIKLLKHFLKMDRIYKTSLFYQQFETAAKENITREIEILSLS